VKKVRMLGSATESIRLLINGSIDYYYESNIAIWDVAAGIAICKGLGFDVFTAFQNNFGSLYISRENKSKLVKLIPEFN